jgi:hypothetical protein
MALVANCHRGARQRAFAPSDFSPFAPPRRTGIPITRETLALLARAFVKKGRKKENRT